MSIDHDLHDRICTDCLARMWVAGGVGESSSASSRAISDAAKLARLRRLLQDFGDKDVHPGLRPGQDPDWCLEEEELARLRRLLRELGDEAVRHAKAGLTQLNSAEEQFRQLYREAQQLGYLRITADFGTILMDLFSAEIRWDKHQLLPGPAERTRRSGPEAVDTASIDWEPLLSPPAGAACSDCSGLLQAEAAGNPNSCQQLVRV